MLTGDLVRVRDRDSKVTPLYVGEGTPAVRERAESILEILQNAAEGRWTRGQVDEELNGLTAEGKDAKLVRGLAKVALDRSELDAELPFDPVELRSKVFRAARAKGPLALERGPLGRPIAADVLAEIAAELGSTSELVAKGLYADLPDEQIVLKGPGLDVDGLIRRYDLALAQSVLLHAVDLRIFLKDPTVPRMRQLFRWIKFHQLVHAANRVGTELHVTLDGPLSLFKQSTRYGLQLASFLPALLLQSAWTAQAEVIWSKRKLRRTFELSSEDGLVSPLADTGAYRTREQSAFAERFAQIETPWQCSERTDPIDLKGRAILLPDFTFTNGKRTAHLEIVGYWRKEWLDRRLDALVQHGPGNLVLAVSRKLVGDERLSEIPGAIVEFAEVVPVKQVLAAVEQVAR